MWKADEESRKSLTFRLFEYIVCERKQVFNGDGNSIRNVVANLFAKYNHPSRKYHNINHIETMIEMLPPEPSLPLLLAVYFHDAVCVPTSTSNEQDSIDLMEASLLGIVEDEILCDAENLILLTENHDIKNARTFDEIAMIELDIYPFYGNNTIWSNYLFDIEQEYLDAGVSKSEWNQGRHDWVSQTLQRKKLLNSQEDEKTMRLRLEHERDQLSKLLRKPGQEKTP